MALEELKLASQELLGAGGYGFVVWLYYATLGQVLSEPRLRLVLLASTVLAACVFYGLAVRRGRGSPGLFEYLLPRRVFLHPSALLDYKYFVVNQLVMGHLRLGRWVTSLVGLLLVVEFSSTSLQLVFGPGPAIGSPSVTAVVVYTVVTLLAWDLGKYIAHYLTHKIPLLWEFHKVHHAAEVLTPMSAFRAHPLDIMIDFFFRLLCTGVVGGVYVYLYPGGIAELTILGFNAVAFVIYYWIAHLQHSHVQLGYGRLSYVLVSPVMHQVHHSCELQHWDKNFGFLFGLWDWMFRTIHVPRPDEPYRLGLPTGSSEYSTVRQLYVTPFVGAARRLFARRAPARADMIDRA